jgi:hypothetical protein
VHWSFWVDLLIYLECCLRGFIFIAWLPAATKGSGFCEARKHHDWYLFAVNLGHGCHLCTPVIT